MTLAEKDNYIVKLESQNAELLNQVNELTRQIEILTEAILQMRRDKFGSSSEKIKPEDIGDQIYMPQVFNEVEVEATEAAEDPCKITKEGKIRAKGKGKRKDVLIKNVEIQEVPHLAYEGSDICPNCGTKLKEIGKTFVRDEIQYIPAQTKILRHVRMSYECPKCKHTDHPFKAKAKVPKSILSHSLASPSSVAHIIYQKFVNGMPLYRQEKEWEELGIELSRSVMATWVNRCAEDYFIPLVNALHHEMLRRDIIHADETPIQVLKEEGRAPKTRSYMWVYRTAACDNKPICIFEYNPSRSGECAVNFLKGFSGYVHSDGYSGYNKLTGITRCACLAHIRRKFYDAIPEKAENIENLPSRIGVKYCDRLFECEKEIKDYTPEDRYKVRLELEKPVLDEFYSWAENLNTLKGSALGKAVTYALNQKEFMQNYLKDGRLDISNNIAENAIRPFVVGRKNWLFSDTPNGAKASAAIYSLVETAKANNLDVLKYLMYLLYALPQYDIIDETTDLSKFMPWSETTKSQCANKKKPETNLS